MPKQFSIPKQLIDDADTALSELHDRITEIYTDEFEMKSERWQDSDKGQSVLAWIETIQEHIEAAQSEIQGVADAAEWVE